MSVALACVVGASALYKVFDFDLFWHINAGRWAWAHHAFPTRDYFTYTAPGPMAYTEGVAELFFSAVDRLGGGVGLSLSAVLLASAFGYALTRTCAAGSDAPLGARVLAVAAAALAVSFRFGPKPEELSFLFFAILLALIYRKEREHRAGPASPGGPRAHARWVGAIAALGVVWGNCHRGGAFAPVVLGATAGAWWWRKETRALAPVALVAAGACALALLVNTGGTRYFTSSLYVMSNPSLRSFVPQHRSVTWSFFRDLDPWALVVIGAWAACELARRRLDARLVIALATIPLPLTGVRYLPFAMVAMTASVADTFAVAGHFVAPRIERRIRPAIQRIAIGAVVVMAFGYRYTAWLAPDTHGVGLLPWRLPVAAAEFVRTNPPPGPMWNSYDFGGYLMYVLYPRYRAFVDGRMDTIYPEDFFIETMRAHEEPAILTRQLERYHIGFAVIQCSKLAGTPYPSLLRSRAWQPVFFDDTAAVVVRKTDESAPYLERLGYRALNPATALGVANDVVKLPPDSPDRGLFEAEAQRNLREAPDSIRAHLVWARLLQARGREAEMNAHIGLAKAMAEARGITLDVEN